MSDSSAVTTVDLLRHGSCEGGEIYRGSTDSTLSEEGWQQMRDALAQAAGWQSIVSSPLSRCRLFADAFGADAQLPVLHDEAFREVHFGEWEGRLLRDIWREFPELSSDFYRDPERITPPGAEPMLAARERACEGWTRLLQQCRGQTVLLVSHGGIIRLLLSHLLDLPVASVARLHIPYASLSRVQVYHSSEGDFPVLHSLNAGGLSQ